MEAFLNDRKAFKMNTSKYGLTAATVEIGDIGISEIYAPNPYSGNRIPQAPCFHCYNFFATSPNINIKWPTNEAIKALQAFPELKTKLEELQHKRANIDISTIFQSHQVDPNTNSQMQFKPQHWLNPGKDYKYYSNNQLDHTTEVTLLGYEGSDQAIRKTSKNEPFAFGGTVKLRTSIHPNSKGNGGFVSYNRGNTDISSEGKHSFWSVCYNEKENKAAITLHFIYGRERRKRNIIYRPIQAAVKASDSLDGLIGNLETELKDYNETGLKSALRRLKTLAGRA